MGCEGNTALAQRHGSGKAGIAELVLWDVILVVLVGALVFANNHLERAAILTESENTTPTARHPTPDRPDPKRPTPDRPNPNPTPTPTPTAPPNDTVEVRAKADLKALQDNAARFAKAGDLDKALALYREAPAWLKASKAWSASAGREELRLLRLRRGADLLVCLRPEIQYSADSGQAAEVEALSALIPASHRGSLKGEVAWARAHMSKKASGMEIRGFRPNLIDLKGQLCSLECTFEAREDASALLNSLEGMAQDARALFGAKSPYFRVSVLEVAAAPTAAKKDEVFVYQRATETPAQLNARVRVGVASWLVARSAKKGVKPWLREATIRLLAGGRTSLRAPANARRRLVLLQHSAGEAKSLDQIARGKDDRIGSGGWALLWFGFTSTESLAMDLRAALKRALRGEVDLSAWLTPLKATGLGPGFLAFVKRGS
jgi:hypothetical protein